MTQGLPPLPLPGSPPYNYLSMTKAKPDPKHRSAFLPIMLLVVGLVVVAGVVVVFVPLVECEGGHG